jgi:hypothetical protein
MIVFYPYDHVRLISSFVSAVGLTKPSAVYLHRKEHFYIAFLHIELIEKHFLNTSHFVASKFQLLSIKVKHYKFLVLI